MHAWFKKPSVGIPFDLYCSYGPGWCPFNVTGALHTCPRVLVGLANGLPLVVIELQKPGVSARAAFDENLNHYK